VTDAGGMVLVSDHRGEITALPGAAQWTVSEHGLHAAAAPPPDPTDEVIVEVAMRKSEATHAVAELRAAGHRILRIQDAAVRGDSPHPQPDRDQEARAEREPR
jgi:ABC-2 type transport system ATP-binding protein